MKTIKEIKLINGEDKITLREPLPTEDIEKTRKELHAIYSCNRILFTFEEENNGNK